MTVVEGSSTVRVVEDAIVADVATTTGAVVGSEVATITGVVVETEAKAMSDTTKALGHRAGKEAVADVSLGPQGGAGVTESEGEEYANFSSELFGPSSIVGSSALRPRARVPHPKNILDGGDIFNDARLEEVWWDRVREIDELKNPTRVVSTFARRTMNVSTCCSVFALIYFFSRF